MNTKQFRIAVGLLALAAMSSLPVSAGQAVRKAKPEPLKMQLPPVYLTATAGTVVIHPSSWSWLPGCKVRIIVRNNTGAVIPKDTTISWSIIGRNPSAQQERKGSFALKDAIPSGGQGGGDAAGVPCVYVPTSAVKAWYVPKPMPSVY